MLVTLATERSSSVGLLTGRADRSLGIERRLDTIWLPLNHPDGKGLVNEPSIFVCAVVVQSEAHIRCRPRLGCVRIANATHVPSFVVLFTFLADC